MSDDSPPLDPPGTGPVDLDVARSLVAERNLVPVAFEHLTIDALSTLPLAARGPSKLLIRRYFSADRWTDDDAGALAEAAGPGEGWWSRQLDDEVTLDYGWRDGRFTILASWSSDDPPDGVDGEPPAAPETVDGPVAPEATPDPETVRFPTGPTRDSENPWYDSAMSAQAYWRASCLFDRFPEVVNVEIGPDSVAVTLRPASAWGRLLDDVQATVAGVFDGAGRAFEPRWLLDPGEPIEARRHAATRRAARLAQVWAELGGLRPVDDRDLAALITASYGEEPVRRQVAATLLLEAEPAVAAKHWERLLGDPSVTVRRATADAVAIARSEALRPLLERALGDDDGWVRQRAISGLVELGPEPSREAITALARDPDFRVRLEVAAFLRAPEAAR